MTIHATRWLLSAASASVMTLALASPAAAKHTIAPYLEVDQVATFVVYKLVIWVFKKILTILFHQFVVDQGNQ